MPKVLQLLECSIGLYWFGQYLKYACIKTDVHSRVGYTMLHIAKNKCDDFFKQEVKYVAYYKIV